MTNITQLDPTLRKLSAQFDVIIQDAATIVLIGVGKDGKPSNLIPDHVHDLPALICGVRSCLYELEDRYEGFLHIEE